MSKSPQNNPGLSFYRSYFRDKNGKSYFQNPSRSDDKFNEKFFSAKNQELYNFATDYAAQDAYAAVGIDKLDAIQHFDLKTTYPGLILGTGYTHAIRALGATKIGFYFDHATGLPILPGSSIKGVLRSVFPGRDRERAQAAKQQKKESEKEAYEQMAAGKTDYLLGLIKKLFTDLGEIDAGWLANLEGELFSGVVKVAGVVHQIPMGQRFVCHDAVVRKTEGTLFGPDFLTPHINRSGDGLDDELKNPIPLQLLKVMPGVHFRFRFQVYPSYRLRKKDLSYFSHSAMLSPERVCILCRAILIDMGIGAKTNVGYGQLVPTDKTPLVSGERAGQFSESETERSGTKATTTDTTSPPDSQELPETPQYYTGKLDYRKNPHLMDAVVTKVDYQGCHLEVYLTEPRRDRALLTKTNEKFPVGTVLKVEVYLTKKKIINAANYTRK